MYIHGNTDVGFLSGKEFYALTHVVEFLGGIEGNQFSNLKLIPCDKLADMTWPLHRINLDCLYIQYAGVTILGGS